MINKCIFIGNITRDMELSYTTSGAAIGKFGIAVNEKWKDKQGQPQERTEFVNMVMFGKRAEALSQYMAKGKKVYVEGKMTTGSWEKDGVKHYKTEINVSDVQLLGGKSDNQGQAKPQINLPDNSGKGFDASQDIPF